MLQTWGLAFLLQPNATCCNLAPRIFIGCRRGRDKQIILGYTYCDFLSSSLRELPYMQRPSSNQVLSRRYVSLTSTKILQCNYYHANNSTVDFSESRIIIAAIAKYYTIPSFGTITLKIEAYL